MTRANVFPACLTLLWAACGLAHADPPHSVPANTSAVTPVVAPAARATQAPRETPASAQTNARVHYSLARHIARAELRQGTTLVEDFGVASGAKYTLGGWLSNTGDNREFDGVRALVLPGSSSKLNLAADDIAAQVLTIRARAFRAGPVSIYVNGENRGNSTFAGRDFETVQITLPAGALQRGENQLQIRTSGTGNMPGGGRASLALDWVALSGDALPANFTPPTPESLATITSASASLHIANGWSLGYAFEVPEGAHLRCTVKGSGGARASLRLSHDELDTPAALATVAASANGAPSDVDLSAFAGKIVRVDVTASGDVEVVAPEVVTYESTATAAMRRPTNVVVYLIDTMRADKLRPINPESRVQTPGLNQFVESAAIMMGAHTQENWTKPSVATLLSSLMPWQHNAITTEAVVPSTVRLAPEILSEQGFYTGAFIANGYVSDRFGFRQGWTTYRNYVREGRNNPAQFVAADVLSWLDSRPTDKPFFLYVHTIDPHVPYRPPHQFLSLYDAAPYNGVVDFSHDGELLEKIKVGEVRLNDRDRVRLQALYDGEVSYHDVHFNSIIEGLTRRGVGDDTMVIVTADHGEEFWDHGSVGHGHSVYEELLHIPMFVRLPGVTHGAMRVPDAVGLVDVLPTILDALGQPIPEEMAGHSFLRSLTGEGHDAPRVAVSGFMEGWRTCAVGRLKFIQRSAERQILYDLAVDPHERNDIARSHPIAVRYARGLLGLSLSESDAEGATPSSAARRPVVHAQETTTIDPETESQLRALGYVGTSRR